MTATAAALCFSPVMRLPLLDRTCAVRAVIFQKRHDPTSIRPIFAGGRRWLCHPTDEDGRPMFYWTSDHQLILDKASAIAWSDKANGAFMAGLSQLLDQITSGRCCDPSQPDHASADIMPSVRFPVNHNDETVASIQGFLCQRFAAEFEAMSAHEKASRVRAGWIFSARAPFDRR